MTAEYEAGCGFVRLHRPCTLAPALLLSLVGKARLQTLVRTISKYKQGNGRTDDFQLEGSGRAPWRGPLYSWAWRDG